MQPQLSEREMIAEGLVEAEVSVPVAVPSEPCPHCDLSVVECKADAFDIAFDTGCDCCCPCCGCTCWKYDDYGDYDAADEDTGYSTAWQAIKDEQIQGAWLLGLVPSPSWPDEAGLDQRVQSALATGAYQWRL